MNVLSRIIENVPRMLDVYATIIPIEYITSIFKFLWSKPLIPAFKMGNDTYKNGIMLIINDNKPIDVIGVL